MKPRYPSIAAAVLLLAFSLPACSGPNAAGASNQPAAPEKIVVSVATAREYDLERRAQVQGALYPREKAVLAAEVTGSVSEISADLGDRVKTGQVLLRIDPREYGLRVESAQAAYDQAVAQENNAQSNFNRTEELNREHLIAAQQYDQSAAALRVAQADADAALKQLGIEKKHLADTYVRAPFDGFVQKRMVALGEHVAPGAPLYEVISTDPIKARTAIPERYVPLVKLGLHISLTIDASPGKAYEGVVTRVAPSLDDNSRTLLVEAEVPNPDGSMKPGYFAHVTVDLGHDRALFVPQTAILRYAGVARVFVVKDGIVRAREVTTGVVEGDRIEVVKGLNDGEKVVTSDIDRLADGLAVETKEQS
ncbi:MAG TPA: efflux RND transporter periplasmic adaptor subunit [Candidatus Binataceae bacterium]|nr:efflux RND transporter periplasmic adaptor subunit [Candidatus Binataceae bacterium]